MLTLLIILIVLILAIKFLMPEVWQKLHNAMLNIMEVLEYKTDEWKKAAQKAKEKAEDLGEKALEKLSGDDKDKDDAKSKKKDEEAEDEKTKGKK